MWANSYKLSDLLSTPTCHIISLLIMIKLILSPVGERAGGLVHQNDPAIGIEVSSIYMDQQHLCIFCYVVLVIQTK